MHNGLAISPSLLPIKYLKPPSLCLNLSDIIIWSTVTKYKLLGCLDLWNYFLLILILSNFSVFSLIFILSKNKTHLFCNDSFLCWISCWCFFSLILFDLVFFFFRQVFTSIPWLFLYCFFIFWIIFSSFFFRISFFWFCKISFLLNQQ